MVEGDGRDLRAIAWGVITNKPALLPSSCLVVIREQLQDAIRAHAPTVCAIESTIFVQSFKTAIVLGTARGAALIAAAEFGLPIYEYAPKEIKQAAVGRGGAMPLPRGQLELRINEAFPDPTVRIVTICDLGKISTLAAATLRSLGFMQAAVGRGGAQKEQVAFMMRSLLRLRETPPPDAADALATALAHFQNSTALRAMDREARRI